MIKQYSSRITLLSLINAYSISSSIMKSRVEINSIKKVIDFNSNNGNHKLVKYKLFIRTNKKKE